MSITELERALRSLRLSGMSASLEARALQVGSHEMDFIEAFSWLIQDELDRRRSRLLDRRYTLSGLAERKDLKDFDWSYNPRLPRRDVLELATLKFIAAHDDALLIGPPGTGKSHVAKALALLAVNRGYKVIYREAHQLIEDINEARELGTIRKLRGQFRAADLLLIDDLFLRRLPAQAGDELADVLMSRYEQAATIITSNNLCGAPHNRFNAALIVMRTPAPRSPRFPIARSDGLSALSEGPSGSQSACHWRGSAQSAGWAQWRH
jgi:DNA replication protein DnaC